MNFKAIYRLAIVLTISQIRGSQRNRVFARIFGNPRIILVIDVLLLVGLGIVGYVLLSRGPATVLRDTVRGIETQALAGIPSGIMFSVILFGVLYEISQPIQSLSTDLVNWLPISPIEYVGASTISESYIYSFMLSLLLGILLGPALLFGMAQVWIAAALMATIALFIGACVVEVLDATTNRISSSFYKKSGRSGMVFRLAITVILLVFVQLLFSGQVIVYLLQSIISTVRLAWFVPVVWPSVAVLFASQGNMIDFLLFASLSVLFALGLFAVAADFRARFWVPVPVSIKLSPETYHIRTGGMKIPGIGPVETAIMRKDFRSLTRRREMARFLAIPFVLAVSMGISFFPLRGESTSEGPGLLALIPLYIIPVAIFVGLLAMTSIGQEGYAVWNLYAAPIRPTLLLKAKVLFATILGLAFAAGMLTLFWLLLKPPEAYLWISLVVGMAVVFEGSAIGTYFGARFPDFREMVRSRYVGVWGSIFGMLLTLITAIMTASPLILSVMFYQRILPEIAVIGLLFAVAVFAVTWKLATHQIKILLLNIRT